MSISYPFAAIPNQIARGGHGAVNLAVLTTIISHGRCTASVNTIAKEVGCNVKSVRKSLKYWKDNAKSLYMTFDFKEGKKGMTNVIEISFHIAIDPDRVLPKTVGGTTKLGRGVLPKTVAKEEQVRRKNKKGDLLSQEEQELGFILT